MVNTHVLCKGSIVIGVRNSTAVTTSNTQAQALIKMKIHSFLWGKHNTTLCQAIATVFLPNAVNNTIDQLKILHFIYFEQYQLNIYSMLGHIKCHDMVLAKIIKSFVYKRQNV